MIVVKGWNGRRLSKGCRKYIRRHLPLEWQAIEDRAQQERELVRQIELHKAAARNKQTATRPSFSAPSFATAKPAPVPVKPPRDPWWTCKAETKGGYFSGACNELNYSNTSCTYCGAARPAA